MACYGYGVRRTVLIVILVRKQAEYFCQGIGSRGRYQCKAIKYENSLLIQTPQDRIWQKLASKTGHVVTSIYRLRLTQFV